jgi:MFS family permease
MLTTVASVISLLMGTAFLLAASGLHGLLLPLRGTAEGFSTTSLALMGTGWAAGFVLGCFLAPRIVRRAGHVRAFGAFAASAAIVALLSGMLISEPVLAGAFMVIESWLNERATNENRGTIFGTYMMVTYVAITAGQLLVPFGDVMVTTLFMATGILFCLSLIPTAVSSAASPKPLAEVRLDLGALYRNSPVAAVGCFLIGIANGAWGTLGAVFGARSGISTTEIALMMSLTVVAGAVFQIPAGRLSDRTDRRYVLAAAAFGAAFFALVIFVFAPRNGTVLITLTATYGALAYILYSIAVAHANDHARSEDFVKLSGGLLLLYGFGTMAGPVIAAPLMDWLRPESIFLATLFAHATLGAYALLRVRARAPVPMEERDAFRSQPSERMMTPAAKQLDPRAEPADESSS